MSDIDCDIGRAGIIAKAGNRPCYLLLSLSDSKPITLRIVNVLNLFHNQPQIK